MESLYNLCLKISPIYIKSHYPFNTVPKDLHPEIIKSLHHSYDKIITCFFCTQDSLESKGCYRIVPSIQSPHFIRDRYEKKQVFSCSKCYSNIWTCEECLVNFSEDIKTSYVDQSQKIFTIYNPKLYENEYYLLNKPIDLKKRLCYKCARKLLNKLSVKQQITYQKAVNLIKIKCGLCQKLYGPDQLYHGNGTTVHWYGISCGYFCKHREGYYEWTSKGKYIFQKCSGSRVCDDCITNLINEKYIKYIK